MTKDIFNKLVEANVGKVLKDEPLSRHTTMKIGGPADILVEPKDVNSLEKVMKIIRQEKITWRAIGRGSNLLVDDDGVEGVVIKVGKGLNHLIVDDNIVTVGAGYPIVPLATTMSKQGLSGLEFAGGIPGSVGGAVYMNAGAHGSDISQVLKKARVLFEDGRLEWLTNEELGYSYRTSILQNSKAVCIEAVLELKRGNPDLITKDMQEFKDHRHRTQPYDKPCAGSIFRNPLPNHAGRLIEEAGLKGYQLGGAQVSDLHANFIINAGGGKAQDVLDLIRFVQKTIHEKYGVDLHTEIEMVLKKNS